MPPRSSRSAPAKKAPPAKKAAPAKKAPPPPAKKAAPPPAKKASPAKKSAKPVKTIAKKSSKPIKMVKIPTSALAERAKSRGRAVKAAAVWEHPDAEKAPKPVKASPAKKAAPKETKGKDNASVKEALKKVATILQECIKML